MNNSIRHSGVVESAVDGCVRVRIVQTSACASCKIASHCNAFEQKEKVIDVFDSQASEVYKRGDNVVVMISQRVGMNAVLVGFVLPFLVLVLALFITLNITGKESLAALISLCALLPYYLCVYFCRRRLRKKLSFTIENNQII